MTITDTLYQEALDLLSNCFLYDNKTCAVYDEEDLLNYSGFDYECGASKVVIILDDCVLKTSYSGEVSECEDEEGNREITENFPDYANLEYWLYQAAAEVGLDKFFAKTSKVDDCVYEQEKIDLSVEEYSERDKFMPIGYQYHSVYGNQQTPPQFILNCEGLHSYCRHNGLKDLIGRIKPDVLGYFLAAYSKEELENLQIFLKKYDINDIRAGNCGWINGELKIFDFCGFKTETEKILSE